MVLATVGVFSRPVRAQTWVEGHITQDTTWTLVDSPYRAINDVIVDSGVKLTVESGVKIEFADGFSLIVNGTLCAVGTTDKLINFTSSKPDPSPGAWNTIKFIGGKNESFMIKHSAIDYATNGITIATEDGYALIEKSDICANSESGILIVGKSNVFIKENTIRQNKDGISTDDTDTHSGIVISGNRILSNEANGVNLYSHNTGTYGYNYITNVTVSSNTISSNGRSGVLLYNHGRHGMSTGHIYDINISSNTVSSNGLYGIHMKSYGGSYIRNVTVSTNNISTNRDHGISLLNKNSHDIEIRNVSISFNSFTSNHFGGIDLRTGSYDGEGHVWNFVISYNKISSSLSHPVADGVSVLVWDRTHAYDLTIKENIITESDVGIDLWGNLNSNLTYNSISYNNYGVVYSAKKGNIAKFNDIYNNIYGVNVTDGADVNAEYNYWGDASGPYHPSLNPEGEGNSVNGDGTDLDFIPFLTSPVGTINQRPIAILDVDKTNPNVDETVTFDASSSTDDGRIDYYFFDFGDGTNSSWTTLSVVTHKYALEDTYNAALIVMDDFGVSSANIESISIEVLPEGVKPYYVEDSFSETSNLEYWLGYFVDEGVFVDSDIIVRIGNDDEVSKVELVYTVHYENNPTSKRLALTKNSGDEYQGNIKETDKISVVVTILNKLLTLTPYPGIPLELHPRFWTDFPRVTADRLEVTTTTKMYSFEINEELTVAELRQFPPGEYVWAASDVDILITDEQGRRLGSIYEDGVFVEDVNEIPDAVYSGHGYPTFAYAPSNIATIDVIGEEEGNYSLYLVEMVDDEAVEYLSKENVSTTADYLGRYRVEDNFIPQYYLTIISEYGNPEGEGWYDEGTTASFSVTSPIGFVIQQVFAGWGGDVSATTPSATLVIDSHKTVVASWRTDYTQLLVIVGSLAVIVIGVFIVTNRRRT